MIRVGDLAGAGNGWISGKVLICRMPLTGRCTLH